MSTAGKTKKELIPKKVLRASLTAKAGLAAFENVAFLHGNKDNFIAVNDKGVFISGKVSIIESSDQVRRGALFIEQPDFVNILPSTIMTPIPQRKISPPLIGLQGLVEDTAYFAALLAAAGV